MSLSTSLEIVTPISEARIDPAWDHARELLKRGTRTAEEFAAEIERLRELYLRDKNANLRRGNSLMSHDATSGDGDGFTVQVVKQLKIHPATAYRILGKAKALGICDQIANAPEGETVEFEENPAYLITKGVREKARMLRESILSGDTPMARALPAVSGAFFVEGGGKGGKAATNHPHNTWAGMQKLRTSLRAEHWRQGKMPGHKTWDDVVDEWAMLLKQLPEELRACTAAWAQKGMPHIDS